MVSDANSEMIRLLDLSAQQQKEISRLREGLERLAIIYESEYDCPCERPAWLRDLLTPNRYSAPD
jgi:hypothetical protein